MRVFALDTGRLPEETYQTADRVRDKYGIEIEWQFPERAQVETLIRTKGLYSFMESLENRHECCGIRKVEPLGRVLAGLDAWVTGLRREQSVTRSRHRRGRDGRRRTAASRKLNPIIGWTDAELCGVRRRSTGCRFTRCTRRGYPSIGCAPLHARDQAGRTSARRPLVVGEPREQGVRPAPGQGHAARARLTARQQRPQTRRPSGHVVAAPASVSQFSLHVACAPHVTAQSPRHFTSQFEVSLHETVLPAPRLNLQSAVLEHVADD